MKSTIHSVFESQRELLQKSNVLQSIDRTFYRLMVNYTQPVSVNYGAKLHVNPEDMAISRRLWREGVFQPRLTQFLEKETPSHSTVIDVGANIGYFSVLMALQIDSDGSLFAFEPEPTAHRLLRQNISENTLSNIVECEQVAVSDTCGEVTLWEGNENKGTHSLHQMERTSGFTIDSCTLDSTISEAVDLVKIDVEGAEDRVIDGMRQIIRTNCPIVIIENNVNQWEGSYQDTFEPLLDAGLTPHSLNSNGSAEKVNIDCLDCVGDIVFK